MLHSMPEHEHVLAAARVGHQRAALALERDLDQTCSRLRCSDFTVSTYDATICGSRCSRHMLSSRIVAPGLSSPARTRPSSTCSLNATTRSVWSPPLVTRSEPMRMRMPLAPATLRAGGWISAGMISIGPDAVAHARGDRAQRLAAALRALARVADHLDDVLGQHLGALRVGRAGLDGGGRVSAASFIGLPCS